MKESLYVLGILALRTIYWAAAWVSPKAKAFVNGRKEQDHRLKSSFPLPGNQQLVWLHCSSLGEFEQGRPVIESLKAWMPSLKILLTFFSPSGYEVRKNYPGADYIFYLPWDTRENAQWFADHVRPSLAVFVKYEFWHHYSRALKLKNIPLISISAIFRPGQVYFKPGFFRNILGNFQYFFVQNKQSLDLLATIGISSASVAGDTRFDRVNQVAQQSVEIREARIFKDQKKLMVIGSAWPDDMTALIPFINKYKGTLKFIIAPHEINERFLRSIEASLKAKVIRFTSMTEAAANADVLLMDKVGLLAQLYRYGEYAFVGGGFKEGLHNTLEAACYGVPIFFGDKAYTRFQEAKDLITAGGAFAVSGFDHLDTVYQRLANEAAYYESSCNVTRQYVKNNLGATDVITDYCKKLL